jgi:hypothetical protein
LQESLRQQRVLALHTRKVAIAQHELDAGLRPGSEPHEDLVLADLLLVLLVTTGQRSAGDLLPPHELLPRRLQLAIHLLLHRLNPPRQLLMHLDHLLQLGVDLVVPEKGLQTDLVPQLQSRQIITAEFLQLYFRHLNKS